MKRRKPLPPTYFVIYLVLAIGLHFAVPWTKLSRGFCNYLGIPLVGVGIWLNLWADRLFKKEKITVKPFEQSTYLIEEGPFAFSRNPMYLGMLVIIVGAVIILGNPLSLIAAVSFFMTMEFGFIGGEEKVLEETFGPRFVDYKKRVRRWL